MLLDDDLPRDDTYTAIVTVKKESMPSGETAVPTIQDLKEKFIELACKFIANHYNNILLTLLLSTPLNHCHKRGKSVMESTSAEHCRERLCAGELA